MARRRRRRTSSASAAAAAAAAAEEEERGVHYERSELISPIRLRGEPPRGLFLHVVGGAGGGGGFGGRSIGSFEPAQSPAMSRQSLKVPG